MLPPLPKLVALDLEATQFRGRAHVVEIAAVLVTEGRIDRVFDTLVDPGCPIDPHTQAVHGISNSDVKGEPTFAEAWATLGPMLDGAVVIAHGASNDAEFIRQEIVRHHLEPPRVEWWCTLRMSRKLLPKRFEGFSLARLTEDLGIKAAPTHKAIDDTRALYELYSALIEFAVQKEMTWDAVREIARAKGRHWPF